MTTDFNAMAGAPLPAPTAAAGARSDVESRAAGAPGAGRTFDEVMQDVEGETPPAADITAGDHRRRAVRVTAGGQAAVEEAADADAPAETDPASTAAAVMPLLFDPLTAPVPQFTAGGVAPQAAQADALAASVEATTELVGEPAGAELEGLGQAARSAVLPGSAATTPGEAAVSLQVMQPTSLAPKDAKTTPDGRGARAAAVAVTSERVVPTATEALTTEAPATEALTTEAPATGALSTLAPAGPSGAGRTADSGDEQAVTIAADEGRPDVRLSSSGEAVVRPSSNRLPRSEAAEAGRLSEAGAPEVVTPRVPPREGQPAFRPTASPAARAVAAAPDLRTGDALSKGTASSTPITGTEHASAASLSPQVVAADGDGHAATGGWTGDGASSPERGPAARRVSASRAQAAEALVEILGSGADEAAARVGDGVADRRASGAPSDDAGPAPPVPAGGPSVPVTGMASPAVATVAATSAETLRALSAFVANSGVPIDAPPASAPGELGPFGGEPHEQIVKAVRLQWAQGLGEARLRLHPEHLGEVNLTLRVEKGAVSAVMRADNATAAAWIEANRTDLQSQLQAQGLSLRSLDVVVDPDRRRRQGGQDAPEPERRPRKRGTATRFEVLV